MLSTPRLRMRIPAAMLLIAVFGATVARADTLPKVLLIGDSIAAGYAPRLQQEWSGELDATFYGSSRGTDYTLNRTVGVTSLVDYWLAQENWDVIHCNWGLWDCRHFINSDGDPEPDLSAGAVTIEQYEANLRILIPQLQSNGARVIWANTTPVLWDEPGYGRTDPDVQAYNAVAMAVMAEFGVEVDDLYSAVKPRLGELQSQAYPEDVHYTPEGYAVLGDAVASAIVPEPATMCFLAAGGLALLRRRTRRS